MDVDEEDDENEVCVEYDEYEEYDPLSSVTTVGQLIGILQKHDPALPVLGTYLGHVREGEYYELTVWESDLEAQNEDGDPIIWGKGSILVVGGNK